MTHTAHFDCDNMTCRTQDSSSYSTLKPITIMICSKYASLTKMSGHYTINDRLVKDSPKIATAPFKSTTERKMMQSPVPYPGPGTYRPFEKVNLKRPAAAKEQTGFQ